MKKLALVALALALGLALLLAAGCGGNKVPQGAIATVGGVPITKAQFDQYINQAKASAGRTAARVPEPRHDDLQPLRRRDRQLPGRAAGRC